MRDDLVALTPEALAALSNRGLVKRAQKMLDKGKGPALATEDDETIVGRFPDGIETRLPANTALVDAPCSCGAAGVCRHRVVLALAYAAAHSHGPSESVVWSPGEAFDDGELSKALGARGMTAARRACLGALAVRVLRPVGTDACPVAELPTCTVKFLVPDNLGLAACDCADSGVCVHVAIAVWAFRVADSLDSERAVLDVELRGGNERDADLQIEVAVSSALDWVGASLVDGVVGLGGSGEQRIERLRRALMPVGATWLNVLVDGAKEQLDAYHRRSACYQQEVYTQHLIGLAARARAVAASSERTVELPAATLLGTSIAPETKLGFVRLMALGVRITREHAATFASVFLVDPSTGALLVTSKRFEAGADGEPLDGPTVAQRRVMRGVTLGGLAVGQLMTKAARRLPNRALILSRGRTNDTSLLGQRGDWNDLPAPVRVEDLASLALRWQERVPRCIRPPVLAEQLHVIPLAGVDAVSWDAGEQSVVAHARDLEGEPLVIRRLYSALAPGALPALVTAVRSGSLRAVCGEFSYEGGRFVVDPVSVVTDRVVCLDLEPAAPMPPLPRPDALSLVDLSTTTAACTATIKHLERLAHRGLRGLRPGELDEQRHLIEVARSAGLRQLSQRLAALHQLTMSFRATGVDHRKLADTWAKAYLLADVLLEQSPIASPLETKFHT